MRPATRTVMNVLGGGAGFGVAALSAGVGYAAVEARAYTLRRVQLPILPEGHGTLRVLHVSDLHMTPRQRGKQRWLRALAGLQPDLVVNTGDNLAHLQSISAVVDALGPLLDVPGVFVMGSNDYFAPSVRNPVRYLLPDDGQRNTHTARLPWRALRDAFVARGWEDLDNRQAWLEVNETRFGFSGVDDPHLRYDDLGTVSEDSHPGADVRVGVTHAPYLRVLDAFARTGHDVVFAGHTHGGQLRVPGVGALVTNCDLETRRARGLHRHPARAPVGDEHAAWLHVSAGLGTSPFAPVRFCCRPEATLLTLTTRSEAVANPGASHR